MTTNYIDFHTHNSSPHSHVFVVDPREQTIPDNFFILGAHPWYLNELDLAEVKSLISKQFKNPHFFGMGEIGIDLSKEIDPAVQKKIMLDFIDYAISLNIKNIIIHCVRAYSEMIAIIKTYKKHKLNFIFHDYNASPEITENLAELGCFFSIGAKLLGPKNKIYKSVSLIPVNKLFFETDDQSKITIEQIYHEASEKLEISLADLQNQIANNFQKIKPQH